MCLVLSSIFESDMPITLLHLMLMSKIYVVTSDMKNVIGMSDPNVMFQGLGPIPYIENFEISSETILMEHFP